MALLVWVWLWLTVTALVLLHELAHALAARGLGLRVERVIVGVGPRWLGLPFRLWGIPVSVRPLLVGGVTYVDERGATTWRRALVMAAGPATSVAAGLAMLWAGMGVTGLRTGVAVLTRIPGAIAEALWRIIVSAQHPTVPVVRSRPPASIAEWIATAGTLSILLGTGNLLPFEPLDGGRLLSLALLALRVPKRVREAVAYAGLAGLLLTMVPSFPHGWHGELLALGGGIVVGRLLRRVLPPSRIGWLKRQSGVGSGAAPRGEGCGTR